MAMLEIPVTLIVKAPNQQVADQTIHCSLNWTIKTLKGHLAEVYPSKPSTEDQRLIYYGQLLNDSVTLKDVFTRYESDKQTHTVHLVCVPPRDQKMSTQPQTNTDPGPGASNTNDNNRALNGRLSDHQNDARTTQTGDDGLRQRIVNPAFVNNNNFQQWTYPPPGDAYDPNLYLQQMALYQHAYANYYMTQYMEMVHRQNNSGDVDQRQRVEADGNVPEPVPQPVENDNPDDDGRANRDWLDYFYIISRLLVLFSIVYFYSSPARFFIVSALGIIFYLYQVGFFRINDINGLGRGENNNVLAEDGGAGVGAAAARVDPQEQLGEDGVNDGAAAAADVTTNTPPLVNQQIDRPSYLALTWTFLTSFFSSMIPEAQNAG